jgi:hypothetical protein
VREVRRHDLPFYAAGLTFHAAIAVVPLLLVAWFVASLVLGDEGVRTLTLALAEYAPTSLGTVVVAAVYLCLVQVVLLAGYVLSLALGRAAGGVAGRSEDLAAALR